MLRRIVLVTPVYLLVGLLIMTAFYAERRDTELSEKLVYSNLETADIINSSQEVPVISGKPINISFPNQRIDVEVRNGIYDIPSKTWTLSENAAHFATRTNQLSNNKNNGLTFIYGHNTDEVFKNTKNIKNGDIIEILSDKGDIFLYEFTEEQVVKPNDVSVLDYSDDDKSKLIVMSCTGTWNQDRRVMNFRLIDVLRSGEQA